MAVKRRLAGWLITYTAGILILLFIAQIDLLPYILIGYSLSFAGYYFLLREINTVKTGLFIGFAIRVVSIFAFPHLSDDIYRFIWDGWLINEFVNPFAYLPVDVPLDLSIFQQFLLNSMNSPEYYSVYPTILQLIFAFVVFVIPTSIVGQSILLKIILIFFEFITVNYTLKILKYLQKDQRLVLLYFLNPLIIVELMGNLHMELVMISAFSIFLYYFFCGAQRPKKYLLASLALSVSVAAKLITLVVSPFLIKRLLRQKTRVSFISFFTWFTVFLGLFFIPMFLLNYENFGKGLDLYFQKFEFNASIYYLIRTIGFWTKGYNIIESLGPTLAIISTSIILSFALFEGRVTIESLSTKLIFALSAYYFLSTTVHPWYTALLVFLSIFSNYRFAILWSFLAVFSYSKYYLDGSLYYFAISIEYLLVFASIGYELYVKQLGQERNLVGF